MPWQKGKKRRKEIREKISRTKKRLFKEGKLQPWNKGKRMSKEYREKVRKGRIEFYRKNPKAAKVTAQKISEFWKNNPQIKKAANEKRIKTMNSAAFKKRMSRIKLQHYKSNPEIIKKMDRTMTAWWREHPHVKKQRSEKVKQYFIKHPEKFKKFLAYGKNPAKPRYKTKQGFLVRSRGEQKIADFLHNNKIKCTYEQYTLFFPEDGQLCTPDFYLPAYKVLIEYYGGHPKSWKKKVMKNKLYKNHKIPCIFITPAELRNLNYYLIRDAEKISKLKSTKDFKMGKWAR